jgi:undecaprenyl diphosphate synthase
MPYKKEEKISLPKGTLIPNHIAIVPDGNRRWARARGLYTLEGHRRGFETVIKLARASRQLGVHTITIWGFSTENWDRTPEEINYLMKLYERLVDKYLEEAMREDVRLIHLGRKDRLPKALVKKIIEAEEKTKNNKSHVGNIALDHGGHDSIIRATQQMIKDGLKPEEIQKETFDKYLDTHDQPYPYVDLFVRTSGEQRTSGLLLWQSAYAETYWEPDHLPDMTPEKLRDAILDYSRRRRRFGGNDNVDHLKFKPELAAKFEINWWRLKNIPEGMKFREYAMKHVKEVFGLSTKLATQAANLMVEAALEGEQSKWQKAGIKLRKFYKLIRDEVKLAFEPSIVASLEVKAWQKSFDEEVTTDLLAETYRISGFQAKKAAHLRSLAANERRLAQNGEGEQHWALAQEYLEKYYKALKDRVA